MSNIWNDEDAPSEYEMLEEITESEAIAEQIDSTPHEVYDFSEIDETLIEEIQEEAAYDLEEDEVASVYNVRTRLAQARLYELLINHNLFEGVDEPQQAINNVQKELKDYIVSRLELLMGLRQPEVQQAREEIIVDQPFNDIEVDFLKALSYKGTNGASAQGEYTEPEVRRVPSTIKPIAPKKPAGLKSLAPSKPKPAPAPIKKAAAPVKKAPARRAPAKKAAAPAKKATPRKAAPRKAVKQNARTNNRKVTQVEMNENQVNMTKSQVQQLAEAEIAKEAAAKKARGGKEWGKMTQAEKTKEIMRANKRNAKPQPANAAPMPDQNAINMHYQTQEAIRSSKSGGKSGFNLMLAEQIASSKLNNGDYDE